MSDGILEIKSIKLQKNLQKDFLVCQNLTFVKHQLLSNQSVRRYRYPQKQDMQGMFKNSEL